MCTFGLSGCRVKPWSEILGVRRRVVHPAEGSTNGRFRVQDSGLGFRVQVFGVENRTEHKQNEE